MRDLDALLNSLVNIDRNCLIAILSSEAESVACPRTGEFLLIAGDHGMSTVRACPPGGVEPLKATTALLNPCEQFYLDQLGNRAVWA